MLLYKDYRIYENFDLSIIMVLDDKTFYTFKNSLLINIKYFQRNGIEIVLVLNGAKIAELLRNFIMGFPFINWKIISSNKRLSIAEALNIGINFSSKKYIFTLLNNIKFDNDVIYKLRLMCEYYDDFFAVLKYPVSTIKRVKAKNDKTNKELSLCGSMVVQKKHLIFIRGFSKRLNSWIDCHNNLFARLELSGVKRMNILKSNKINLRRNELDVFSEENFFDLNNQFMYEEVKSIFYPNCLYTNDADWDKAKIKYVYDWQNNSYAYKLCREYLKLFPAYQINSNAYFKMKYKIIALVPTYNEQNNINSLIKNIENHCDGIIILDDSSNDCTYEIANSTKLLLKVKKQRREFNDLENRNILLNLASFFHSEWYFFIDADERFDERFSDIYSITGKNNIDSVLFKLIELWDDREFYRSDLPVSANEKSAFRERYRMFKNQGRMQLLHDRKLHFYTVPYKGVSIMGDVLLHHYGTLNRGDRLAKYNAYLNEDSKFKEHSILYEYLLDENVELKLVSELRI